MDLVEAVVEVAAEQHPHLGSTRARFLSQLASILRKDPSYAPLVMLLDGNLGYDFEDGGTRTLSRIIG
jgi:hypothetical protein